MWIRQHAVAVDALATIFAIAAALPAFHLAIRSLLSLRTYLLLEPLEPMTSLVLFVVFPALTAVGAMIGWMTYQTACAVWPHGRHRGVHP